MIRTTRTLVGEPRSRSNLALGALALGAFVIGTAELVIVGVLDVVAADTGVSISTAGLLVTSYALGISIGGPVVTALTIRFGRTPLLSLSLGVFIVGNVLVVVAMNFGMLIAARVLTGSVHGLFIGVASAVAASLVQPDHRGRAIGMVFGGIAVSTVLGVPLGTLVGQALGWRAAFVGIVILGVVALAATLVFVPAVEGAGSGGFGAQARAAFAPRVLAMLGVGLLLLAAQFTALTYLTPFLGTVTGISGGLVSAFLLAYGVATAIGTFLGGRFADRNANTTLVVANIVLIGALAALYQLGATPILAALALIAWGLVGFALVPSLQLRVITPGRAGRRPRRDTRCFGRQSRYSRRRARRRLGIGRTRRAHRRPGSRDPLRGCAAGDLGDPIPAGAGSHGRHANRCHPGRTQSVNEEDTCCSWSPEPPATSAASWYGRCSAPAIRCER